MQTLSLCLPSWQWMFRWLMVIMFYQQLNPPFHLTTTHVAKFSSALRVKVHYSKLVVWTAFLVRFWIMHQKFTHMFLFSIGFVYSTYDATIYDESHNIFYPLAPLIVIQINICSTTFSIKRAEQQQNASLPFYDANVWVVPRNIMKTYFQLGKNFFPHHPTTFLRLKKHNRDLWDVFVWICDVFVLENELKILFLFLSSHFFEAHFQYQKSLRLSVRQNI